MSGAVGYLVDLETSTFVDGSVKSDVGVKSVINKFFPSVVTRSGLTRDGSAREIS